MSKRTQFKLCIACTPDKYEKVVNCIGDRKLFSQGGSDGIHCTVEMWPFETKQDARAFGFKIKKAAPGVELSIGTYR